MNKGYTLLELVIYIAILSVLSVTAVGGMLSMVRTFGDIRSMNDLRAAGSTALDRMVKETRFASSVDMAGTVLNVHPGRLKLSGLDENGNPATMEFEHASSTINFIENGVNKGSLTGGNVAVDEFIVRYAPTPRGGLVKIELSLSHARGPRPREASFYGSAVLRGAY